MYRALPEPPAPPNASAEWHKQRLVRVYANYNPEKVKDVDALLQKYTGREEQVFTKVCEKYGVPYKCNHARQQKRRAVVTWYKPDENCEDIRGLPAAVTGTYTESGTHHGGPLFTKDTESGAMLPMSSGRDGGSAAPQAKALIGHKGEVASLGFRV
jgi:hypothetical protein